MIKALKGWFVEEKSRVAVAVVIILVLFITELFTCYVLVLKNRKLTLEIEKLNIQVLNPMVIEKPVVKTKYIERVIYKDAEPQTLILEREAEPQTLILEREVSVERNEGKQSIPITEGNQPSEYKWTAGVIYDGTVGGVITHRVYKTMEAGVEVTGKMAGVLATVKFQ